MLYEFLDHRGTKKAIFETDDPEALLAELAVTMGVSTYQIYDAETVEFEQLKKHTWYEMKKAREAQKTKGFLYKDVRYDGDTAAQTNIANAAGSALAAVVMGNDLIIPWTAFNNEVIYLTAQELVELQATMVAAGANIQAYGTILRNKIDLAETKEELAEIVWEYDETVDYISGYTQTSEDVPEGKGDDI